MAKYDQGGGCPCGLHKTCICGCYNQNGKPLHAPDKTALRIQDAPTLINKWDRRYMEMAYLVSTWSKDPSSKIGAVCVNRKGQILSTGYNGFPRGIKDTEERLYV